jgi:hypothetical protein
MGGSCHDSFHVSTLVAERPVHTKIQRAGPRVTPITRRPRRGRWAANGGAMTTLCLHNCRIPTRNQRIRATAPPPAGSRPAPSGSVFRRAQTIGRIPLRSEAWEILAGTTTTTRPLPPGELGWDQHGDGRQHRTGRHHSDSHRSFPAVASPGARNSSCLVPSSSLQPVLPACTCIVHPDSFMVESREDAVYYTVHHDTYFSLRVAGTTRNSH